MRVLACVTLMLLSAGVGAAVAPEDVESWRKLYYHEFEHDTDEEGQVSERLAQMTGTDLRKVVRDLAADWGVSEEAADAAIEIVMFEEIWRQEGGPDNAARIDSAYARALAAAPRARQFWEMRLRWLSQLDDCDASTRERYFAQDFAARFLELDVCHEWYPEYARRHPDDLEALDALRRHLEPSSAADALALADIELARDAAPRDRTPADLTLYLLRSKLATLKRADLGARILEFVAALPPPWRTAVLEREVTRDVTIGTRVVATAKWDVPDVESARVAWLVSLIEAGHDAEARAAIEALRLPYGRARKRRDDGDSSQVFATAGADSAEFLRDLTAPALTGDLFARYAGDGVRGLLWGPASAGLAERRLAARMLRANSLPSPAQYLEAVPCSWWNPRDRTSPPVAGWRERMPVAFRDAAGRWAMEVAAARARTICIADELREASRSSQLPRYREVALTPAERLATPRPNYTGELPLPAGFALVRAEQVGTRILALCQSPAVDPAGEVGGGGYWLLRSVDGRTFDEPLYLGFQAMHPYVITETARVPLLEGDTLRIEVKIRELDPASITFPPVALRHRRSVDDLVIEIPLATLEQDSDRDGFTDLLERRIATNPEVADTDGDGIYDGADDLPLVAANGPANPLADLVAEVLHQIAGFDAAAIVEPVREPGSRGAEKLFAGVPRASSTLAFTFIHGDRALFNGVRIGANRVLLVLDATQVEDLNARYGPTFPLEFPMLVVDAKRERAVVTWSAGWTGGTLEFSRKQGQWRHKVVSGWIS